MRRRIIALSVKAAFGCVLLGMTGCSGGGDFLASLFGSTPGLMAEADDAMKSGNAADAEKLYTDAIDSKTLSAADNASAYLGRGLAREKLGHEDDALADFTLAVASNALSPDDAARAQYDRGVALDALGRSAEAADAFTGALKLKPDFAQAYTNRGNARLRLGDLMGAKSDYEAALAAGIASPAYVWYGLGQIAQAQGDFAGARDCYKKALGADPGYSLAAARLADLEKMNLPERLVPPPLPLAPATQASFTRAIDTPAPAAEPKRADAGNALIQLGAFRDKAVAAEIWERLVRKTGGLLDGLTPSISSVDLPDRGRFWRLRAGVSDRDAAASLCDQLKSKGVDCFEVKG